MNAAGALSDPRMIAAVLRAELARRDITGISLIGVLPLERTAVYDRLKGKVALTQTELRSIADHFAIPYEVLLGVTPADPSVYSIAAETAKIADPPV